MQPNRLFRCIRTLALLTAAGLISTTLHAQTFKGRTLLNDPPYSFEASIFGVGNRLFTIRVNINNKTPGPVRVLIRNSGGRKVYDDYVMESVFRGDINLSSLSIGNYTIDISKQHTHFMQEFTIEPPIRGNIIVKPIPQTLDSTRANALTIN